MPSKHLASDPLAVTVRAKTPLDKAMLEREISNAALGAEVGADKTAVSRWRNGLLPSDAQREAIAKALDLPITDLWG